jgi:hypothetical protein
MHEGIEGVNDYWCTPTVPVATRACPDMCGLAKPLDFKKSRNESPVKRREGGAEVTMTALHTSA